MADDGGEATSPVRRSRASRASWSSLSPWSTSDDAPRKRRPSDLLGLAVMVAVLVLLSIPAPGPTAIDTATLSIVALLPGLVGWLWASIYVLVFVWALALIVTVAVTRHRRVLLVEQLAAAVGAGLVGLALAERGGANLSDIWSSLVPGRGAGVDPPLGLCVAVGVIAVTGDHLTRPYRRFGFWLVIVGAFGALGIGLGTPLALSTAVATGVLAATAVHAAVGSPAGQRPMAMLVEQLAALGVTAGDLRYVGEGPGAVARGTDASGAAIYVHLYNRDAFEGSFFRALWDRLWYRRPQRPSGRRVQAEHDAVTTMLAARAGVPVQPVIAVGEAYETDTVLVREDIGQRLGNLPASAITAEPLTAAWRALAALHGARIAHGSVSTDCVYALEDGSVRLADLGAATSPASASDRASDRSRMLVITATFVGADAAIELARAVVSDADLTEAAAFLQPAALDRDLRKAAKSAKLSVKQLRESVIKATGAEAPPLERLRRVNPGTLVMMVAIVAVAYVMIAQIAGIGWDNLVAEFQGANWWWVLTGVLVASLVYVGQAIAFRGASVDPLPFVPVLGLETAISFVGLVIPASAAKIGLSIRFLQLAGSNPVAAVPISLIDSVCGLLVQLIVIVLTLLTGLVTLTPATQGGADIGAMLGSLDWGLIVFVAVIVIAVAILVLLRMPRVRGYLGAKVADGRASMRVLRMPRKLAQIVLGSVMWNVLLALVLGCALHAFGADATFAELILINTLVALFSGLMPIPGNVGVAEAALTAGLVAIGIDSATAMSAAIVYRLATYVVPPVYGYASLRVLRAKGYL